MSRQIQIRRGTAAEHETFTGAVGEVTFDTTNKTLRVHDGEISGGIKLVRFDEVPDISNADFVTEFQIPNSSNGYTWYRKYKSGWLEQGGTSVTGKNTSGAATALVLPFTNTHYHIVTTIYNTISNACPKTVLVVSKTLTSFNTAGMYSGPDAMAFGNYSFDWRACGYIE